MTTRRDADGKTRRGVSNGNERGNSKARAARRAWLLETWAADVKLIKVTYADGSTVVVKPEPTADLRWWRSWIGVLPSVSPIAEIVAAEEVPTARCYKCGDLLHDGTITVDRIIPGCFGGTYRRDNIRPACGLHNSSTGGALAAVKVGKTAKPRRR